MFGSLKSLAGYGTLTLAILLCGPAASVSGATSLLGQRGSLKQTPQSYIGIDVRDIGDDQVSVLKVKDTRGAEIIRVDHDGPAGKMGLREHDVILQMNGVLIDGQEQLRRMLNACPPGKSVVLVIGRDGQTLSVSAPMADRSDIERQALQHFSAAGVLPGPQAPEQALPSGDVTSSGVPQATTLPNSRYSKSFLGTLLTSPTYTGAMLEVMGPQLADFFGVPTGTGLLVRSVADNSPASMAGLRAGDVVVKANAQAVTSVSHWTKTVREAKGRPITVLVLRDRQEKTLILTPDLKHRSSVEMPFEQPEPTRLLCLTRL